MLRQSRQTTTHTTADIAIQASDEPTTEENKTEDTYDFSTPFLFSDMILLVEDEKLHCHRAILSLYSPVFKAMFQSRFEETSSNQVSLPQDDAETVRELLRHMYTPGGRDMDSSAAQRLLPLIHRFQIESLITTAERTMTFSMTDSMAPKMLALADLYQLNHLKQAAIDACSRLDMKRMTEALEETTLSADLKATIFGNRIHHLEKAIADIERSFTHSCIRMESKLERVYTNHCQIHNKPLSNATARIGVSLLNASESATQSSAALLPPAPPQTNNITSGGSDIDHPITRPLPRRAPIDPMPLDDRQGPRLTARVLPQQGDGSASSPDDGLLAAIAEVPVICEGCVDRISTHIKDICRRALHKTSFVVYKPPTTPAMTTNSAQS